MTKLSVLISLLLLPSLACTNTAADDPPTTCAPGAKCDDGTMTTGECSDPRYGDGTCQTDLTCAAPDIDCFDTFETDADAAAWFAPYEAHLAQEQGRAPRSTIAEDDPRFVRIRALLDAGWVGFRDHRPVADLKLRRPGLVVLDDPEANAFVAPNLARDHVGFTVMVQTGLLATGSSDDAILGVMMHELQHAIGLHVLPGVGDSLRTFYVAGPNYEPFGIEQAGLEGGDGFFGGDPRATPSATAWRTAAEMAGIYVQPELGGLPYNGELQQIFLAALRLGDASHCTATQNALNSIYADLGPMVDPITLELTIDPAANLPARIDAALAMFRDDCLPNNPTTFYQLVGQLVGQPPDAIASQMSVDDRALIDGKHVIDAISALALAHRATMRDARTTFEAATDEPWHDLRFFSIEEDADDVSVRVMRGAGKKPAAIADFLLTIAAPACQLYLLGGVPPYGEDYLDEHHGTCWRVYNANAYAAHTEGRRAERARVLGPVVRPLVLPRFSDSIAY